METTLPDRAATPRAQQSGAWIRLPELAVRLGIGKAHPFLAKLQAAAKECGAEAVTLTTPHGVVPLRMTPLGTPGVRGWMFDVESIPALQAMLKEHIRPTGYMSFEEVAKKLGISPRKNAAFVEVWRDMIEGVFSKGAYAAGGRRINAVPARTKKTVLLHESEIGWIGSICGIIPPIPEGYLTRVPLSQAMGFVGKSFFDLWNSLVNGMGERVEMNYTIGGVPFRMVAGRTPGKAKTYAVHPDAVVGFKKALGVGRYPEHSDDRVSARTIYDFLPVSGERAEVLRRALENLTDRLKAGEKPILVDRPIDADLRSSNVGTSISLSKQAARELAQDLGLVVYPRDVDDWLPVYRLPVRQGAVGGSDRIRRFVDLCRRSIAPDMIDMTVGTENIRLSWRSGSRNGPALFVHKDDDHALCRMLGFEQVKPRPSPNQPEEDAQSTPRASRP